MSVKQIEILFFLYYINIELYLITLQKSLEYKHSTAKCRWKIQFVLFFFRSNKIFDFVFHDMFDESLFLWLINRNKAKKKKIWKIISLMRKKRLNNLNTCMTIITFYEMLSSTWWWYLRLVTDISNSYKYNINSTNYHWSTC